MASRSYSVRSLLVAWRRKAVFSWSAGMPQPSSVTRRKVMPPWAISTVTDGGPGVDGVFHQLLGHAGGPLHHLAGGDQVGNVGI